MIPRMAASLGGRPSPGPSGRPACEPAVQCRRATRETWRTQARAAFGKPLDGVRVLAAEQMQALPYATQLLARLGADVVKVEHPVHGESGRASTPAMLDPEGRKVGATYLRNNLDKRSVGIDLKSPEGRELFLALVPQLRRGRRELQGRDDGPHGPRLRRDRRRASRARSTCRSPASATRSRRRTATGRRTRRSSRRCRASTTTASPDEPPVTIPVGALGDISSALFGVIGVLAALRHRERTGEGQYVDIAMFDAMVAMTDIVTNFWSLGVRPEPDKGARGDLRGLPRVRRLRRRADRARAPVRRSSPSSSATRSGRTTRASRPAPGWAPHLETVIRPAVDAWASQRTKLEAAQELTAAGIVAGPSNRARRRDRRPARRGAPHARRDAAHRRRRRAGARARQPGEAVEGGRGPRDPRAVGRRAHRRGAARRARPRRRELAGSATAASSPDQRSAPAWLDRSIIGAWASTGRIRCAARPDAVPAIADVRRSTPHRRRTSSRRQRRRPSTSTRTSALRDGHRRSCDAIATASTTPGVSRRLAERTDGSCCVVTSRCDLTTRQIAGRRHAEIAAAWTSTSRPSSGLRRGGRALPRRARRPRRLRPHPREHGADRRHAEAARVHGRARRAGLARPDLAEGVRRLRGRRRLRVPAQRGARRRGAARRSARASASSARRSSRTAATSSRRSSCRRSCATTSSSRSATASPTPAPTPRRCGSRPSAASATASRAGSSTARRRGPPRRTSPSGTGSARAPIPTTSTAASRSCSCRSTSPASRSTASGRWATSAPTRCSSKTCSCPTSTSSARSNRGFQYISQALDLERFTMFTFSPIKQRLDLLIDYVRTAERDGEPLRDDPVVRQRHRAARHRRRGGAGARPAGRRRVDEGREGAGHAAADGRVVAVQAVRDRVLAPARRRVDGHRRRRARQLRVQDARTRRWRAGPSRRTATP